MYQCLCYHFSWGRMIYRTMGSGQRGTSSQIPVCHISTESVHLIICSQGMRWSIQSPSHCVFLYMCVSLTQFLVVLGIVQILVSIRPSQCIVCHCGTSNYISAVTRGYFKRQNISHVVSTQSPNLTARFARRNQIAM